LILIFPASKPRPMPHVAHPETVLATLPAFSDDERIQVILSHGDEGSVVSLVQQSWAEGVGWFTQNALRLSPQQVQQLRWTLGSGAVASTCSRAAAREEWDAPQIDGARHETVSIPFAAYIRRAESA
jgi:hypothetical protein